MYATYQQCQHHIRLILASIGLLCFTLAACGRTANEEPSPVPTATSTPTPAIVIIPTVTPSATSPATLMVDVKPQPTVQPVAVPVPTPPRIALIRYRDNELARAGSFRVLSTQSFNVPADQQYDLWLTSDGKPTFRIARIDGAQPILNMKGNTTQNLLTLCDGAMVTVATDGTPNAVDPVLLHGQIPGDALRHIRRVADRTEGTPDQQGYLIGAQQQAALALDHAHLIRQVVANGDMIEVRRHTEHVINILYGRNGELFGDLDGDGVPQNPGDGYGLLSYLASVQKSTGLAASSHDATAEIKLHAEHVQITAYNAYGWASEGINRALRILAADSSQEAAPTADALVALMDGAYRGMDANGDSIIVPTPGEGGLLTAYEHALNMASIELYPLAESAVAQMATETVSAGQRSGD